MIPDHLLVIGKLGREIATFIDERANDSSNDLEPDTAGDGGDE